MNVLLVQPASLVFRGVRGQGGEGAEQGSGKVLNPRVPISTLFGLQSQAELWGARKGLKLLLSSCLVQYLWIQVSTQLLRLQKPGVQTPAST